MINLKFCICTVPRRKGYIHKTIESLGNTGFFEAKELLPLRISVAHPDSTFLSRYEQRNDMMIWRQSPEEAVKIGYDNLNVRQLSTWGHIRAMNMLLRTPSYFDYGAILEDDVVFSRGWIPYLYQILEKLIANSRNRWILSLFQFKPHIRKAFLAGKTYTEIPIWMFNGAPCFIYPKKILPLLIEYMMENGIRNFRQVNDFSVRDFAVKNKIPVYASVPCLIQHMGDETTGQSDPNVRFKADMFLESVEHLVK